MADLHRTVEVPAWGGYRGDFVFSEHRVAVDADGDGVIAVVRSPGGTAIRLPMTPEQAERLGRELIAAARARKAGV